MAQYSIITVDSGNVDEFGLFCVKNRKHPGYTSKRAWLEQRFKEGLRIKMILTVEGEQAGFLESVPGEYTWRTIEADDYLVIHCIWVNSGKYPYEGMASDLLTSCIQDATTNGMNGVAVVSSDGPWMAGKEFFMKHGFDEVDQAEPYYQLLVKKLKDGSLPSFPKNWKQRLEPYKDLQLLYTNQCPYIGKAVAELPPVAHKYGIPLKMVELNNPLEARELMPSPYGMFNLVYQAQLIADHPISATRFRNILEQELKLVKQNQ